MMKADIARFSKEYAAEEAAEEGRLARALQVDVPALRELANEILGDFDEIHIIADNLSAHKTKHVAQFLAAHPHLHLHYTPTYSSWLNQVENWFAKIEREVIARGVFTSVKDLARKLMGYIRHYNQSAKPLKWTYRDPTHRITRDAVQAIPI